MQAHVLGLALLRERGVRLLASNGSDLTDETDEMTEAMIHIAAVFAALEKKRLVKKLRHARDRKRERDGKCEGRKAHSEMNPDAVKLARRLHRASPKTGERLSLRKISAELAAAGFHNEHGEPYHSQSIRNMIQGALPRPRNAKSSAN